MRKFLFISIANLFLFGSLVAQNLNVSYTDCNGNSQALYEVLGSGKVLLIASKGLDCSICMNQAPANESFAAANIERISVWGAMSKRYSASIPTCTELNNWKTTYSWNNIFMFIDADKNFEGDGYPTYYVISPVDSNIYFTANSFTTASQKATQLADSLGLSTSIKNIVVNENNITLFNTAQLIIITSKNSSLLPVTIYDNSGKVVYNQSLYFTTSLPERISINSFQKGIYFISVGNFTKKIALY
jgi:hypothetical protein